MKNKYAIIGDLHGCFVELADLLKAINYFNEPRQIISVGDVIDKGPKPLECFELLKKENTIIVMGNHCEKHLRFHEHELKKQKNKIANPMAPAKHPEKHKDFWFQRNELLKSKWDVFAWMKTFPYYHYLEDRKYCVIHAGVTPGKRPEDMDPRLLCRTRNIKDGRRMAHLNEITPEMPFWFDLYYGETKLIYGHIPFKEAMIRENSFGIDTGCVYGNKLSCLLLPEEKIVQVPAHKQYAELHFPWPDQE